MNNTGQGAIEYLLIIGAAVIIAVIVIALMMSLAGTGTENTQEAGLDSAYSGLMGIKDKHKGVMTITLKFTAGVPTDVIVPDVPDNTINLNDLFPNAPVGTTIQTSDGRESTMGINGWDPPLDLDSGEKFTIVPQSDFEQEVEVEQPANNVIMIYDCDGLLAIEDNMYADYSLGKDIYCDDSTGISREIKPIGFGSNSAFGGTLEGNGMAIGKLSIVVSENETPLVSVGLFTSTNSATITGIEFAEGFSVSAAGREAGLLVGNATSSIISGHIIGPTAYVFANNATYDDPPVCAAGC